MIQKIKDLFIRKKEPWEEEEEPEKEVIQPINKVGMSVKEQIKQRKERFKMVEDLRNETHYMWEKCRRALIECDWDYEKAKELLLGEKNEKYNM